MPHLLQINISKVIRRCYQIIQIIQSGKKDHLIHLVVVLFMMVNGLETLEMDKVYKYGKMVLSL